jgi:hypothetical protein
MANTHFHNTPWAFCGFYHSLKKIYDPLYKLAKENLNADKRLVMLYVIIHFTWAFA